jgi:hypothetical protein
MKWFSEMSRREIVSNKNLASKPSVSSVPYPALLTESDKFELKCKEALFSFTFF